jgi:glucose-6-phosphate isomerase, archaeal
MLRLEGVMTANLAMVNWTDGSMESPALRSSVKKLGQLKGIFQDDESWQRMDHDLVVYRVWWWEPVAPGTQGGLFWGTTEISPGRVGKEYFMTHGHQHAVLDRAEFYGTTVGSGVLVLRDESGQIRHEEMMPGSLHYIPGKVAHRVVNTGKTPLRFIACWPSDAGHDYAAIATHGLGLRVMDNQGRPAFVADREAQR